MSKIFQNKNQIIVAHPVKHNNLTRYIYLKKHSGKLFKKQTFSTEFNKGLILEDKKGEEIKDEIEQMTRERTIFVTNIGYDYTEKDISQILSSYGKVEEVRLGTIENEKDKLVEHMGYSSFSEVKPNSFVEKGSAHVLFEDEKILKQIFKKPKNEIEFKPEKKKKGLEKYLEIYQSQKLDLNKDKILLNKWMKRYDKKVKEEEDMIEALEGQPDKDGFIKVLPKKGKKRQAILTEEDLKQRASKKVKKTPTVEIPLYSFQQMEKKKGKIELLREQFQKDKEKIKMMKQQRKFKPF